MRSLNKLKWKKTLKIMIVAFCIFALLKPVQAGVGSYGRFDSVEVFSRSGEASNVNYNDAGYFEGEVPRVHSDVDHILIRGNCTFKAKYRDTIKVINYFYASYHYYIAAGLGHAIIQTFYYIYEKETGLLSGPWEIFRDGGYHTRAWSSPDEGQTLIGSPGPAGHGLLNLWKVLLTLLCTFSKLVRLKVATLSNTALIP